MLTLVTNSNPLKVMPRSFCLIVHCIATSSKVRRLCSHFDFVARIAGCQAVDLDRLYTAVAAVSVKVCSLHEANRAGRCCHGGFHTLAAGDFFRRSRPLAGECSLKEVLAKFGVIHAADDFKERGPLRRS